MTTAVNERSVVSTDTHARGTEDAQRRTRDGLNALSASTGTKFPPRWRVFCERRMVLLGTQS